LGEETRPGRATKKKGGKISEKKKEKKHKHIGCPWGRQKNRYTPSHGGNRPDRKIRKKGEETTEALTIMRKPQRKKKRANNFGNHQTKPTKVTTGADKIEPVIARRKVKRSAEREDAVVEHPLRNHQKGLIDKTKLNNHKAPMGGGPMKVAGLLD